ncbi:hypothetical protein CLF_106584, partial [Clonorchis sinensis]
DMPSVLAKLRKTGHVLVWQLEEGHYSHICFSRWQQIALFRRFPVVVNVDGTHAANHFRYKLYTFLITDGMGIGRPFMYAFVESEQFAPMRRLFGLFKEVMAEQPASMAVDMPPFWEHMYSSKRPIQPFMLSIVDLFHGGKGLVDQASWTTSRMSVVCVSLSINIMVFLA